MFAPRTALPKLTDRLQLGTSGLEVSPFCLGLVNDPEIVVAAFEAGINFFFVTADMHWPLYEGTRLGLKKLLTDKPEARDSVVIGVVSYVQQPEFCWAPFMEVLEAFPSFKRIDVSICGGSYGDEIARRLGIYAQHRKAGFMGIKSTGATFHDRSAILPTFDAGTVDIGFVRYNPNHPGAASEVFPKIREDHPLLFNFKSADGWASSEQLAKVGIADDFWHPHQTDYYRFALSQPALDGILCALPHVQAVRDLEDALAKGPLDEEDQQYLRDIAELLAGKAKVAEAS
ncbi:MAG TPA: hypothetical protein VL856_19565 [Acidimicrobiia bacterium]|nr:hypothetical protein [Acidimicrobiia bacterium]